MLLSEISIRLPDGIGHSVSPCAASKHLPVKFVFTHLFLPRHGPSKSGAAPAYRKRAFLDAAIADSSFFAIFVA